MTRKKSTGEILPLNMMIKGTVMYKVRSASKWYKRKYKVDIDNLKLSYSPSTKQFWTSTIARVIASKCIPVPPQDSSIVSIRHLIEVRKGWNTDVFQKLQTRFRRNFQRALHPTLISMLKEDNCFSLVIAPDRTIASGSKLDNTYVVDLIAPSMEVRDAWVRGLNQLIACSKIEDAEERWLIDRIREADVNGNGSLNFEECLGLLKQLNIGMRRSEARKLFDRVKIKGQDALGPEEFIRLYRILNHRPELEEIMKKYSASRSVLWDAEELKAFLYEEQRDAVSIEDCKDMIDEYEPEENKNSGFLSLEGFQKLLTMGQEDIFNKRHRTVYQDMTQPLTHYYIATSHNTYLIQDQLLGESSIEGYVQALKRGCRCLELDTWDGPDEEPIIFHGYTLTSRILLKDVLEAIKKYAFSVSQYPIILSIENHCSVPYQEKMAHYFRTILGEYLYTDCIGEDEKKYPSPEALSKKIFIKGKKLKDELMMSEECHFMLEEEEEREEDLTNALASAPTPPGEGDEIIPTLMAASSQRKRIAKELSDLVNYFSAKRFSSFEESKNSWEFNEMTSLSETVALNLGCTQGLDFVEFNKKHFSRIYPKGTRTDSSNFDPFPFWNLGCQMVALNYQTWDKFVYLNEAKFAQNGKCGYLLKPEYLTSDKISYDPNKPPYPKRQINVTIKVVSAQYLPKPPCASETDVVDPYVSIKVVGHPADQTKKKTSFISNNGFNPVWNETFNFVVNAPEQAIFYFCVKDQNITSNALIGQFALPCSSINEGYRHVYLEDCRGQKLEKATLFVHVQMSESEQE